MAKAKGAGRVVVPSVSSEYRTKLHEIQSIIDLLRVVSQGGTQQGSESFPLRVQRMMDSVRQAAQRKNIERFVDAVEVAVSQAVAQMQTEDFNAIAVAVLIHVSQVHALIMTNVKSLGLSELPALDPSSIPPRPGLTSLPKSDRPHIEYCEVYGSRQRHGIVFVAFDGGLMLYRSQVALSCKWVRLATFAFLEHHLNPESDLW